MTWKSTAMLPIVLLPVVLLTGGCPNMKMGPPPLVQRGTDDPLPETAPAPEARPIGSTATRSAEPSVHDPVQQTKAQWLESQKRDARNALLTTTVHVMVINGEAVTADELIRGIKGELGDRASSLPPREARARAAELIQKHMLDTIARLLLYQHASKRTTEREQKLVKEMAEREIRRIASVQYEGVVRRFEQALKDKGSSIDEVRNEISRDIIIRKYLEEYIKPKVSSPTRAELVSLFEQNADMWRKPERRRMRLIDIRIEAAADGADSGEPAGPADSRAAARQRAEAALTQLQAGTPFADVAREYSAGTHAEDGGEWGWVSPGSLRERLMPAVEQLNRLKAGETSGIVEGESSFFIVQCAEIEPAVEPTFESVQQELQDRHFTNTFNRLIIEEVERLRTEATIEPVNLDRFLKGVVEELPVAFPGEG